MRPSTSYFGNFYWRTKGGKERGKQIFINDRNGILIHAKELTKGKQDVRLCIVAMHYNYNDHNDHSEHYWYDYKDGDFIERKYE